VLDLSYGAALFSYYEQDYFAALNLLHVAQARGGIAGHGDNPALTEAGISLAYGMESHASEVFAQLLDANRPLEVRNAAWFYLARLQYSRGKWTEAQASLNALSTPVDETLFADVQALRVNLAIRLNQLDEALLLLTALPADSSWQSYLRFNLGAAFSRAGNHSAALSHYDSVRDRPLPEMLPAQSEPLALKDKALTAAGYSLMLSGEPVEAIKRFVGVRKDSPWSDRALLGYGWSALESKNYRLALRPWQALVQRPANLSSTQEALLALPFVYEQLDATGEALAEWQRAELIFTEQLQSLDHTLESMATVSLVEAFDLDKLGSDSHWLADAETYPVPDDLQTLQQVLSSNVVREKMQGLRDLSRMRIGLHTWREKITLYKALVDERSQQRLAQRDSLQTLGVDQRQQTLTLERDEKQKQLENILAKKDYLALASGETAELLEILDRARGNIETLKAAGESVSYEEEAYQRYRGILLWRASETYSEQVWMAKKHLRGLDQALLSLGERKQTIDKVLTEAPDILPWLDKLDQKSLAIDEHNARVERAISRAEGALRQELLAALKQQRQHLKSYLAQTRLAIARLLDSALRAQES
jgi:hypothetical protein